MKVNLPFTLLCLLACVSFIQYFILVLHYDCSNSLSNQIKTSKKSSICSQIKSITVDGETLIIKFNNIFSPSSSTKEQFALLTHYHMNGQKIPIFFPLNSSSIKYTTTTKLALQFYLPFVEKYSAQLICCDDFSNNKETPKTYQELKPFITSEHNIRINVDNIYGDETLSRMKCYGRDWRDRWCEGTNIGIFSTHFYFNSPASFHFPDIFILPGARGHPFDKKHNRLIFEPYVSNSFPHNCEVIKDETYICDTFWNYHMIWHIMMDLVIPLRRFMRIVNDTVTPENRTIFLMSDGLWIFFDIMRIFSKKRVILLEKNWKNFIVKHCYIGMDKPEDGLFKKRGYKESIYFKYNFDKDTDHNLRHDLFRELKINQYSYGNEQGKKLVLLIDRETPQRAFLNIKEIQKYMQETCDICDVQIVKFHNMMVREQLEIASKASVLMGVHGCGLTHVFWMHESQKNFSTHLIEILPYKYNCRDWYNTAANVARVTYHSVMNKNPPETLPNNKLTKQCLRKKFNYCASYCHDRLRDQNTTLEIDALKDTWNQIVGQLKSE